VDVRDLIHETAVVVRESFKPFQDDNSPSKWGEICALLSKEDGSAALVSAVNSILQKYDQPPVQKVTGFDVIVLDELLEHEAVCRKCDPTTCPYKGAKLLPEVTPTGIHAKWVYCEPYYRHQLIEEIEDLAQKKLPDLQLKSTQELEMLRNRLKRRIKHDI